jgi:hypothetical protein
VAPALVKRYAKGTDSDATDAMVAYALRKDPGGTSADRLVVAAPLSHGSNPNSNMAGRRREDDENLVLSGPLGGGNDGIGRRTEDDPNLVTAFSWQQGDDSKWTGTGRGRSWVARAGDYAAGMSASGRHDAISSQAHGVRRLTPTECERLQALPDGWTDYGTDSKRYAALGDAVTASVSEWLGHRIMQAATTGEARAVILRNAAECRRCGDVIESKHRHDFVRCSCGGISVDGGRAYLKRGEMEPGLLLDRSWTPDILSVGHRQAADSGEDATSDGEKVA